MNQGKSALAVLEGLGIAAQSSARTTINEAVADASIQVRTTTNFGFVVPVETAEEAGEIMKSKIEAKANGAQGFYTELTTAGIVPAAVLPIELWHKFSEKFSLFRFEHISREGEVSFETKNLFRLTSSLAYFFLFALPLLYISSLISIEQNLLYILGACQILFTGFGLTVGRRDGVATTFFLSAIGLFVAGLWILPTSYEWWQYYGIGLIEFVASFILLAAISGGNDDNISKMGFSLFRHLPKSVICKMLWPKRVDRERGEKEVGLRITFPTPPKEFAQILTDIQDAGFFPCIAADPRAIGISRQDFSRALDAKAALAEEERLLRLYDRVDPMCYTISHDGKFVAFFSQFGDSVSEKKAMKWAITEGKKVFLK